MNKWLNVSTFLTLSLLFAPCIGTYSDAESNVFHRRQERAGTVSRSMQTANCPKMKLDMSCEDYFVAIWDGSGGYAFDSYMDGLTVDICYDPTQCYLFEMESYSDECDRERI